MERKIRVGAVSYLNTKPLIYGFENGMMTDAVTLTIDYPSKIAEKLISDELDIGLVPVAIIPQLKQSYIISDYCIACNGPVASVCLFSEVPLKEIKSIILDYQSRTSVSLLKVLLKEHWKMTPALIMGETGYEDKIEGTTAGLVIGDRAFGQRLKSKYMYDLGEAWKEMTGFPFVFAAWVSNIKLDNDFLEAFNKTIGFGLNELEAIVAKQEYTYFGLMEYYTKNIHFQPEGDIMEVIELFLCKVDKINSI
ncbi:MAG: menaquinone biosynthesis protein [Chitinophagaceae bacterium]|nr:menaquinone biosynthesis protein [Chitinophagaceae bacterium]